MMRFAPSVRLLLSAFGLSILLSSGCAPDESLPTGPAQESVPGAVDQALSSVSPPDLVLHEVARSLAMAMAEPRVRASVIRGMQGSPYNEHKLVLASFLDGPAGGELRASAGVHGATEALLHQVETLFPDGLDFYLPSRDQRRNWAGSDRLLVVGVADLDATEAYAFDVDGNPSLISSVDVPGYDAVIVIHPAEPKVARTSTASAGAQTVETGPEAAVIPGPVMNAVCNPEVSDCSGEGDPGGGTGGGGAGGGGGGGGSPPPATPKTRVTSILPDFDDGIFGGDLELYFATAEVGNPSNSYQSAIFDAEPYVNNGWLNVTIFDDDASPFLELLAVLWESDGFPNGGHDWKGEPWPVNIEGSGNYASFDPFNQIFWAEYEVVVNQ